ncbi:hypothetical protein [Aeromicrobium endophyticum]|uniref:hypothetical protein n=1 Tax=Aeromicrobium endophyticum TaxID=2292704 RepID=UPI0011C464FE|nr:hypothetical protein [Aeromicrobium endophyticum]
MSEIDAEVAYETVLAQLQSELPSLSAQVIAEVERGRELNASEIFGSEKARRDRDLTSQRLGKLSDADLASVELTPEERLMVLVRAISVETDTYNGSAGILSRFASEYGADHFTFINPGEEFRTERTSAQNVPLDEERSDSRSRSSFFDVRYESEPINREAIDAALAALDGEDEYN